jgi:glutathione S-transferase
MSALTLYDSAISGNAYKVRLLLAQLHRPYVRVPIDLLQGEARAPAFRAKNPFYRYVLRWEPSEPHSRAIVESLRKRGFAALRVLEEHLSAHEFLVGERYSVADISLFGYTPLSPEGNFPLDDYPAVRRWLDRVRAQPDFMPMS